ncbi:NAD(P)-dependent alcohol dehydrogenase [Nonomuraea sp. NPDC005692]|uniref:NAD(P)-dependent alcohol dehydrogenase n=1 Tax=Nonomuraea sp. NPDC005692 TaxID=3157168 RepID=UPI0033F12251
MTERAAQVRESSSMLMTAAVTKAAGAPFELRQVELAEPSAGEVLVRLVSSGICRSDLIVRDQWYPVPLPVVLGHEGAGIVEAIGAGPAGDTALSVGDHVVLSFDSCGTCRSCLQGAPAYCANFVPRNFSGTRRDGTTAIRLAGAPVHGFFGQSSFATHSLASLRCVSKVPEELPLDLLGPLGCGVQTGAGSVLNSLRCEPGSSIAVFGAGAVGCSAVMAAVIAGCAPIVAVGRNPARLRLAEELGATHTIDLAKTDPVKEVRALTANQGVDYSIEAAGVPSVLRMAVDSLTAHGACGLLGGAAPGTEVALEMSGLMFGRQIRGIVEGDSVPQVFIPLLAQLHAQGRLPFDKMITAYPFDEINRAAADCEQGVSLKPILLFGER